LLRPFQSADFETLYQIDQLCYPRGIAYSRRTLKWFLALPEAECIVGESDDAIAGFILTEADESRAHVITIDVLEAHRRRGLGTSLLREAERRLTARGVREVHLETAQDNAAAIAFWQRHGYRKRGVLRGYYLDRIDAIAMIKEM
jgi:ribosomal protein S18 acetylase RimI-like enzyme